MYGAWGKEEYIQSMDCKRYFNNMDVVSSLF